jgi:hypothetical protein
LIRRAFILAIAGGALCAGADNDVFDLFASMALGLAEDNVPAFVAGLSASMPGRARLIDDVRATVAQAEVTSEIATLRDEGNDARRTVVLDWSVALKRRGGDLRIERRRESVTCTVVREGGKWRVASLEPAGFFAPPNFR